MELIDAEARNVFSCCAPSTIKCIAETNRYGNRIRMINKSDTTIVCPVCNENKDWDHTTLCEKITKNNGRKK